MLFKVYYISYYPPNKHLEQNLILNNLELGVVVKFDFDKKICHYKIVTVDCNEVIILDTQLTVACNKILLIDKCIENVFPAYKINEHRYGVGHSKHNTIHDIKSDDEIIHSLAETKILDEFLPQKWLYET